MQPLLPGTPSIKGQPRPNARLGNGRRGFGEGQVNTGTILVTHHLHIYVYNIVLGIHLHISSEESVIMLNSYMDSCIIWVLKVCQEHKLPNIITVHKASTLRKDDRVLCTRRSAAPREGAGPGRSDHIHARHLLKLWFVCYLPHMYHLNCGSQQFCLQNFCLTLTTENIF